MANNSITANHIDLDNTMTASSSTTTEELNDRIQNLPQELQDWIKELVIDDGMPSSYVNIDDSYKPPLGLQIDHKSREKFAKEFYRLLSHRVVEYDPEVYSPAESLDHAYEKMRRWLWTLSTLHIQHIATLRFDVGEMRCRVTGITWFPKHISDECNLAWSALTSRVWIHLLGHGIVAIQMDEALLSDETHGVDLFREPIEE
ncbi:uncharacterized protein RCC_02089 [Ramularia collo-cygni]|uniref:Uncharacterized protein n=1 Tax=Ramularia collo-cygni TaxID=112498 RepID=A0A2D3UVS0_9PEZI|nr:uncharacterized protein RCC_02089 [Ramularia collo-cygni]CZT16247.1 uncharacterized protein RCC_02089 [Ramularia collo-cygni]